MTEQHLTPVATRPQVPPSEGSAAVYRLYGSAGDLLYIGSTSDPSTRWSKHKFDKPWWPDVAAYTLAWQPGRADAYADEYKAIRAESPRYNVLGVFPYGATQPVADAAQRVIDALDALEEIPDMALRAIAFSQVAADQVKRGRAFREQRRQMVLEYRAQGVSYRKIATLIGASLRVVQDLELGYSGPGSHRPKKREETDGQ